MTLDDLKERFTSEARVTWERIQESTAYNQLKDRYDNMTPGMQKLSIIGVSALVALIILSIPYGYYSTSQDYVTDFEGKRMTIRELLKVTRESSDVPQIPQAPPISSLQGIVDSQIQSAHLLPEQIKGTQTVSNNSKLIPSNLTEGMLEVSLAKLNLHQILDMGHRLQSINPSVKLKDMVMSANREDSRYFDVVFKLVALAVPAPPEVAPPEPPSKGSRKKIQNEDE
ncbi:hypothetical protein [Bdellovibrio sp. HCB2-146]|uniref:hypothetical protein n=1 Tax=Bdellovibrio sp. HCB2-146 TaxID=3394362 RepID=UPI0039BC6016